MNTVNIDGRMIGEGCEPYIIAEMSGNHNQSLQRALELVDIAADCHVDALKLQTYKPETMTLPGVFRINDDASPWGGNDLYDLYKQAFTPWEWHEPIFERAKKRGLTVFSTPFDESAVEFLLELNVPAFKIASFENTDWPLLERIGATTKPVIISLGAATVGQIGDAVHVLESSGCESIVLLKCTSTYPADPKESNLLTIPHLQQMFGRIVGISDHTLGIGVAIASIALGAQVVEKHFTTRRADGGVDSTFSLEPHELSSLVEESKRAYKALGTIHYGLTESEQKSVVFKRSIFVTKEIESGEVFTRENTKVLRPGIGLEPKYYGMILGKKSNRSIKKGTPLTWDLLL